MNKKGDACVNILSILVHTNNLDKGIYFHAAQKTIRTEIFTHLRQKDHNFYSAFQLKFFMLVHCRNFNQSIISGVNRVGAYAPDVFKAERG